jgi:hypothetical protein
VDALTPILVAHPWVAFLVVVPFVGVGLAIKLGMIYLTGRDDPSPPSPPADGAGSVSTNTEP